MSLARSWGQAIALLTILRRAVPMTVLAASVALAALWVDTQSWMPNPPTEPHAGPFYGALAGFSGVFLGFYFTALGLAIESVYAGSSRTLRSLILRGRAEQAYVRFVVFLGVLSLILLAVEAQGRPTGFAAVSIAALGGAVALVGASRLMTEGLRYFDAGVIAREAREEFVRTYGKVDDTEPSGIVSNVARKYARTLVEVFGELSEDGDPAIAHRLLSALREYWKTKPERSWGSGWWPAAIVRPDWFRGSSSEIKMAVRATGQLSRETKPDLLWVERDLAQTFGDTLARARKQGDTEAVNSLLVDLAGTVRAGAESLLVEECALLIDTAIDVSVAQATKGQTFGEHHGAIRRHDTWDTLGACVVQLVAGARMGWGRLPKKLEDSLREDPAAVPDEIERLRLPLRTKKRLEDLAERLKFEAVAEGSAQTPQWYWIEHLLPVLLWELKDQFNRVEDVVDRLQGDVRPALSRPRLALSSASAARRTLEIRNQWSLFRDEAREVERALRTYERAGDFELPELASEDARDRAEREREEDFQWLEQSVGSLLLRTQDPAAYELLGHAYTMLSERCVEAIVETDAEALRTFFSPVFRLASVVDGRVPMNAPKMRREAKGKIAVQPALDAMAISGLALMRDEVSGPGFWTPVRDEWDRMFDQGHFDVEQLKRLITIADNAVIPFGYGGRYIVRTRWRQTFSQQLSKEGIETKSRFRGTGTGPRRPLLRTSVNSRNGIDLPEKVFAAAYLAVQPMAAGIVKPGGSIARFLRQWREAQNRL